VLNIDDKHGTRIAERSKAAVITYGTTSSADVSVMGTEMSISGTRIQIKHASTRVTVSSSLTGRFNISNILAAYATGIALGIPTQKIVEGIQNLRTVRGRFDQIISPNGWTAIVDYAHTPDALENCLQTIREVLPAEQRGKIITVFGCGGNRDRGKRPLMGTTATELSDVTVITSDNPRDEKPENIISEITEGVVRGTTVHIEVDRRKAIVLALDMARSGDVVLVVGKGHEDYQIIGGVKHHFDDREEIERYITARQ
jgi:UDP-N-acetylmuramoyl-L-alanyl-D-glutamate--2,6-diaminopimelate ligase